MSNWCRNEVRFNLSNTRPGSMMVEAILDFLKETIPNYDRRIRIADKHSEITGVKFWDREVLDRFIFDFNNLAPYPDEFRNRDEDSDLLTAEEFKEKYGDNKDGYNNGGYEWCVKNWGSKWSPRDVVWVPQHKTFYFDTAWAPVTKIVSLLHKRFPEVGISFEYYEQGVGLMGGCEFIPEEDWDPADYTAEEVFSLEQAGRRNEALLLGVGPPPAARTPEPKWEAGKAYNPWSVDYMGFKGG